jgi:hypothetical protein
MVTPSGMRHQRDYVIYHSIDTGKYPGVLGHTHREIWFASALADVSDPYTLGIYLKAQHVQGVHADAGDITLSGGKRVRRRRCASIRMWAREETFMCKSFHAQLYRWAIGAVCAVYLRRYRLRDTALEVFFRKGAPLYTLLVMKVFWRLLQENIGAYSWTSGTPKPMS